MKSLLIEIPWGKDAVRLVFPACEKAEHVCRHLNKLFRGIRVFEKEVLLYPEPISLNLAFNLCKAGYYIVSSGIEHTTVVESTAGIGSIWRIYNSQGDNRVTALTGSTLLGAIGNREDPIIEELFPTKMKVSLPDLPGELDRGIPVRLIRDELEIFVARETYTKKADGGLESELAAEDVLEELGGKKIRDRSYTSTVL